ncbi:MAG: hypothetical protein ACYC5S_07135 [Thiobacillus sp.]
MSGISEDVVEQAILEWLAGLGWSVAHGPDIFPPDARNPGTTRDSYREGALLPRHISGKLRLPEAEEQLEEIPA